MRHRQRHEGEAVLLRLLFEHGQPFLAESRVVVEIDDLLALELVEPAFLGADVLDHRRRLAPVGRDHREDPREDAAVGGVGATVADRHHRNLVGDDLVEHRVGDAGRHRLEHRIAGRAFLLQPLVALDAARVVVFGLTLFPGQLDAADAAVALVDHRHVVDPAAEDAGTAGGVGADAVARQADELLLRLREGVGDGRRQQAADDDGTDQGLAQGFRFHPCLLQEVFMSVRERPEAQLLLADLPQSCQTVRFHDQEEDDQTAEDDQLQIGTHARREDSRQPLLHDHVERDR